jgi:hypothetical protein
VTGGRCEQRAISGANLRPRHLATQYLELVAQHQQLEVLDVQPTATSDDRAEQGPEREVQERESHTGDRFSPRPEQARHEYWRPSGAPDDVALIDDRSREVRQAKVAVARRPLDARECLRLGDREALHEQPLGAFDELAVGRAR